jgi:hypothetical protein
LNAKELFDLAENTFSKKSSLNSLHQEIAEHFYPERATFTLTRSLGEDFAGNLHTSYPLLCRRDLGNQFSVMLRPTAKQWFHTQRRYQEDEDNEVKRWLENFEETQRRAMYDPIAQFQRATKEGDHDFAAFGQCALSIEVNHGSKVGSHLLYRCWHLKDMAWQEDEAGKIETKFRRWKPTAHTIKRTFKNCPAKIQQAYDKDPFSEHDLMHMVVPAELYDKKTNKPYWSIWYYAGDNKVVEETPLWTGHYAIPRWQTVSGSQYSYSPATVAALPDARLIQAMTYALLEASEKATRPPMVATKDAVRSDLALYAGGVTWVDMEYDERLGDALRPITQDFRGLAYGPQMNADVRALIREAFFLNKLGMPQRAPEMTAYEVGQRVQEYIRNALPIFEPMEAEYNAAVCEDTFELLWRNGTFGDPRNWPKALHGAEIEFRFESPLHDAIEQQKGHKILEAKALLADAVAIDPSAVALIDVKVALRDALEGIQTPAKWMRSQEEVEKIAAAQEQAASAQQMLASMEQASVISSNLAGAQQGGEAATPMPASGVPAEAMAA